MSSSGGFTDFLAYVGGDNKKTNEPDDPAHEGDMYAYEEQQEKESLMKSSHLPMKKWFNEDEDLQKKYGSFPLFWQDLKTWEHYKEVQKLFLVHTENPSNKLKKTQSVTEDNVSGGKNEANADDKPSEKAEAKPRRRKSRWGDAADKKEEPTKIKKSRWGAPSSAAQPLANAAFLNHQQQQSIILRAKLDVVNHKINTVAALALARETDPNRSPSPPPQYDSNGKRTNTREVRMRATLEKERQLIIDELVKTNPSFRPPSDYIRQKLNRKIYIPIKEFPNYNFIGLIIGPRGNTQKRMEKESNCKIAIRGRGSVKEGSRGKKLNIDEDDDLHVLITGERVEDIDKAEKEIKSLLVPVDDTKNDHKQKQLRELALINGTLRDDDYCHICGEKGHRQWECPNREDTFKKAEVTCEICGDSSHPTSDCTQKKTAKETAAMDKEYMSFMEQLGEKPKQVIQASSLKPVAPWLQPQNAAGSQAPWSSNGVGAPGAAPGAAPMVAPGMAPGTASGAPGVAPGMQDPNQQNQYTTGSYQGHGYQSYWDPQRQQWVPYTGYGYNQSYGYQGYIG